MNSIEACTTKTKFISCILSKLTQMLAICVVPKHVLTMCSKLNKMNVGIKKSTEMRLIICEKS